jgi:hypothetical protein
MKKVVLASFLMFFLFTQTAFGAVAVDASSPNRVSVFSSDCLTANTDRVATTAAFNPPDNSVLIVLANADTADTPDTTTDPNVLITNNGAALTWTQISERDRFADVGANNGHVSAFYATLTTGRTGMTVTATNDLNNKGCDFTMRLFVVTGANMNNPIGNKTEGSSATSNLTTTTYTSSVNNSLGFFTGTDWSSLGTPLSTGTTYDPFRDGTELSGISGYNDALTTPAGSAVSFNLNAGAAGTAAWNWLSFEVVPPGAAGASATPAKFKLFKGTFKLFKGFFKVY